MLPLIFFFKKKVITPVFYLGKFPSYKHFQCMKAFFFQCMKVLSSYYETHFGQSVPEVSLHEEVWYYLIVITITIPIV